MDDLRNGFPPPQNSPVFVLMDLFRRRKLGEAKSAGLVTFLIHIFKLNDLERRIQNEVQNVIWALGGVADTDART